MYVVDCMCWSGGGGDGACLLSFTTANKFLDGKLITFSGNALTIASGDRSASDQNQGLANPQISLSLQIHILYF